MIARVTKMTDKGFGFAIGDNGIKYFFHRTDFNGFWVDLQQDFLHGKIIHVTCEVIPDSPKGPRINNVKRIGHPDGD